MWKIISTSSNAYSLLITEEVLVIAVHVENPFPYTLKVKHLVPVIFTELFHLRDETVIAGCIPPTLDIPGMLNPHAGCHKQVVGYIRNRTLMNKDKDLKANGHDISSKDV